MSTYRRIEYVLNLISKLHWIVRGVRIAQSWKITWGSWTLVLLDKYSRVKIVYSRLSCYVNLNFMFGWKCDRNLNNKKHNPLIWNWKNKLLRNSVWKRRYNLLLRKHHCCRGTSTIHLLNWKIIVGSKMKVWITTCYIYIVSSRWNGIYWPDWIRGVSWIKEYLQW